MNCPICFDEINASTGSTILSCSHTFHLTCIVRWYSTSSSCPCCRVAPNEKETILLGADKETTELHTSMLEVTKQLLIAENSRLEKMAIRNLNVDQKRWYQFSKYLERYYPDIFKVPYADDGMGNEVILNAFLNDRIKWAEGFATHHNIYKSMYAKFLAIRIDNKRRIYVQRQYGRNMTYKYESSQLIKSISIEALQIIENYQDIIHSVAICAQARAIAKY